MANAKTIDKAYKAISLLRARGEHKVSVDRVSRVSGIARASFYQDDPDWKEVLEVIKGKPSQRIKLVEVSAIVETKAQAQVGKLASKVKDLEAAVAAIEDKSERAYKRLVDQVLYFSTLAAERPKKKEDRAKHLKDLNAYAEENRQLKQSLALAQAAAQAPIQAATLVSKKTIILPNKAALDDVYDAFIDELDHVVPNKKSGEVVGAVYITCGLPMSGKSRWINEHKSLHPGAALYIETTAHIAKERARYVTRIRSRTDAPIYCVRLRASLETCVKRSIMQNQGAKHVLFEKAIERVTATFEEVSLEEKFYGILLA